MIRVVSISLDHDLRKFSGYLGQQRIAHRIIEESGEQVVFVRDQRHVERVKELAAAYLAGQLQTDFPQPAVVQTAGEIDPVTSSLLYRVLRILFRTPISSLLTIICVVVALVTGLGRAPYRMDFLFYPELPVNGLASLLGAIDSPLIFMQTLTPMFLHFGELHIVFNLLWLWYFGRQLEVIQSSWVFLLVVVITSFVGNTAQYLYSEAANFGGMSGVVYGLVGYAWVLHKFVPGKRLMVNESLFVVFVVALVLMELLASSMIASAAHLGGLIAGLLVGLVVFINNRVNPPRNT